ncbi:SulP family inorganic anion transporter [Thiobacillus denitrificans]|uniref:DNA repair protein n=1 Tax=Thiobacillus denitrificans TaxID=36861 RepID=A0A119CXC2_THIDE|nr:SulP family inorganic anion transporter [Thiobacillus denitrificans]KVW97982.1 DNA repair protein [Thiobacillus denitrificans]
MPAFLTKFLPFLRWFPMTDDVLKADFMAGLTVALVLIPQSMAYAQLAGLPAYYGLYAAFLPVAVAALWGSSNQLGTGPVAVVSLLTASSLAVLAVPGSDQFIALAIMLALLVGIIQLLLGVFKLGVIVNFLSHPVIVGFTNAAAIIIALSQVSKLFGVPMGRSEHFINDIVGVFQLIGDTHLPTLAMGALAIALMWSIKKYASKLPGVLIAVVVTTLLSWSAGFERNAAGAPEQIADPELLAVVQQSMGAAKRVDDLNTQIAEKSAALKAMLKNSAEENVHVVQMEAELGLARIEVHAAEAAFAKEKAALRHLQVVRSTDASGATLAIYAADRPPQDVTLDETPYRLRKLSANGFQLVGGGEVVGSIPEGLPSVKMPSFNLDALGSLLSAALVISLVGFMEAISIAKAVAARTRQRIDPNQELVGQGLANVVGSFTQAFPVSGSFSRTAVNMNAGAKTGMSSVITALIVLIALLFLTPLLYHLPQAVLAAIIIMAVVGLVNFKAVKHAWQASRHDGIAAVVTFIATLAFAPHLDKGIMVGAGLALGLYLYRTMSPRVAILGRYKDGTLRDLGVNPDLPTSKHVVAIRFDGSLYFANVSYFEDAVLEAVSNHPDAKYVLVVGDAINQLDASGEEVIHHLVERLNSAGITLVFSGLKKQVLDVMRATGLFDTIGQDKLFATVDQAIAAIYEKLGENAADDLFCAVSPER